MVSHVYCFPYAGGSVAAFAAWQRALGRDAVVCPVRIPGRPGTREPRYTALRPLVDRLVADLGPHVDAGSVFYGHSMGALVAYGVARRLADEGAPLPGAIIAGAYPAPHLPAPLSDDGQVPSKRRLLERVDSIGGLHPALRAEPRWAEAFLPALVDDLLVCSRYRHDPAPPLSCPIVGVIGADDPLVDADDVAAWAQHTRGGFTLEVVDGGHFFINESPAEVTAIVARAVLETAGCGAPIAP